MLNRFWDYLREKNRETDGGLLGGLICGLLGGLSGGLVTGDIAGGLIAGSLVGAIFFSIAVGYVGFFGGMLGGILGAFLAIFPLQTLGVLAFISSPFLFKKLGRWWRGRNIRKTKRDLEGSLKDLDATVGRIFISTQEIVLHFLETKGLSALKPKAEDVLASLPALAREIRSMDVVISTSSSDINRQMYYREKEVVLEGLVELSKVFTAERLRLEEASRVEKIRAEPKALHLPTVAVFAELTDDILRTAEAVRDAEEATPPETALEREFRELESGDKPLPFLRRKTGE